MTTLDASKKWKMKTKKVQEFCKKASIPQDNSSHHYIIPDDMKAPYYPDKRNFKNKSYLHVYLHVIEAIATEKMIIPCLIETDSDHIRTAVRELRDSNVIVPLDGHEDNLEYENYMIGMHYSDWLTHSIKEKLEIIKCISSIGKDVASIVRM